MKIELQRCYVLHSRPYRDTSLIIDVFSQDHGRLSLLARGYRQSRARNKPALQAFVPYLLSWQGRGELKTLSNAELAASRPGLLGNHLYSGLYSNELLVRLLPANDAHADIFDAYERLLEELGSQSPIEPSLRRFELDLLDYLGYGINFEAVPAPMHTQAAQQSSEIAADTLYRYFPETGFIAVTMGQRDEECFAGSDLINIQERNFYGPNTLRAAKKLLRMALVPHLGNKPLRSRDVFLRRNL